MLRHDRWLQRALWLRVPPHLPAWWLPPTPQATPTHRRAPPKQLGGSLRPQQSASAHSKGGECPAQALRGRGDVPHARVARQVARLAPPRPCPAGAGIRVPSALRIAVGGARRARGRRRRRRRAAGQRRATSGGGAADGGHAVRRGAAGAGDAAGHDAPARRPVEDAVCPVWGPPPSASLDYPQARAAPAQLRGLRRPEELASAVAQRCVAFNFNIRHFLRCLKPNMRKRPDAFDGAAVLRQLRYTLWGGEDSAPVPRTAHPKHQRCPKPRAASSVA